jgi:uncharacterized membrane protein HdeD (DUF308 family)
MARSRHTRPAVAHSEPTGGSIIGSIGLVVLLAAGVVTVSYPQLALAAAVGAVGTHLAVRGMDTLRSRVGRRRLESFAARVPPGLDRDSRGDRTRATRSVPDHQH